MPKSQTFTCPNAPTSKLCGLTSRCTMPTSCAATSAWVTCCPVITSSAADIGRTDNRSISEPPAAYSITMHGPLGPSMISSTLTTYG